MAAATFDRSPAAFNSKDFQSKGGPTSDMCVYMQEIDVYVYIMEGIAD